MKSMLLTGMILLASSSYPPPFQLEMGGTNMTEFDKRDFTIPIPGSSFVDQEKYNKFLNHLEKVTYKAPSSAIIDAEGKIIPEKPGTTLNKDAFTNLFYTYFYNDVPMKTEVPILTIYPKVDSELLSQIRHKKIGQYTTYFNSNNKSRTHNIHLASEAINNYVVFPGETFSFNKVVGKRTVDKGYLRAPIIVRGELSEGIGGGICQVSSTLFNAVDRAGINIIERYSHSKRVPYVPPGRDATVSWYGPDFSFENGYNQPILIRSRVIGGQMIITVLSSEDVNYEPRKVPKATTELPKEITIGTDFEGVNQE